MKGLLAILCWHLATAETTDESKTAKSDYDVANLATGMVNARQSQIDAQNKWAQAYAALRTRTMDEINEESLHAQDLIKRAQTEVKQKHVELKTETRAFGGDLAFFGKYWRRFKKSQSLTEKVSKQSYKADYNLFRGELDSYLPVKRKQFLKALKHLESFRDFQLEKHDKYARMMETEIRRIKSATLEATTSSRKGIEIEDQREMKTFEEINEKMESLKTLAKTILKSAIGTDEHVDTTLEENLEAANEETMHRMKAQQELSNLFTNLHEKTTEETDAQREQALSEIEKEWQTAEAKMDEISAEAEKSIYTGADQLMLGIKNSAIKSNSVASVARQALLDAVEQNANTKGEIKGIKDQYRSGQREFERNAKAEIQRSNKMAKVLIKRAKNEGDALNSKMQGQLQSTLTQARTSATIQLSGGMQELLKNVAASKLTAVNNQNAAKKIVADDTETYRSSLDKMYDSKRSVDGANANITASNDLLGATQRTINQAVIDHEEKLFSGIRTTVASANRVTSALGDFPEKLQAEGRRELSTLEEVSKQVKRTVVQPLQNFKNSMGELDNDYGAEKGKLGMFLKNALVTSQQSIDKGGVIINTVVPAVKNFAKDKAISVFDGLEGLEKQLKSDTAKAVTTAATAEIQTGQKLGASVNLLTQEVSGGLRAEQTDDQDAFISIESADRAEEQKIDDKVDSLDKEVKQTKESAKWIEDGINKDTKTVEEHINELKQNAQEAVADGHDDFTSHLDKMEKTVRKRINDERRSARNAIKDTRSELRDKSKRKVEDVLEDVATKTGDVSKSAERIAENMNEKLGEAKEEVRVLSTTMQGFASNEDEWAKQVSEQMSGDVAKAHRNAMVSAKSRVAQEAAIAARFGDLQKTIIQDVDKMDASKQNMLFDLSEEAKKEAQRILQSDEITQEEKMERLKKVDAWLTSNLNSVKDKVSSAGSLAEGAAQNARDFQKEARAKASEFISMMQAEDEAAGVQMDRRAITATSAGMDELIAGAREEVNALGSKAKSDLEAEKLNHETRTHELSAELGSEMKALSSNVVMSEATASASVTKMSEDGKGYSEEVTGLGNEMKEYETATQKKAGVLSQRLGEVRASLDKKLGFLGNWQNSFQRQSAESIELMTELMSHVAQGSNKRFAKDKVDVANFAERLETALNSDQAKILRNIMNADRSVDQIGVKDDAILEWMGKYEDLTTGWRKEVAKGFDKLTGGLSGELMDLAHNADQFGTELNKKGQIEQAKLESKLSDAMKGETKAISDAEDHMAGLMGSTKVGDSQSVETAIEKQLREEEEHSARARDQLDTSRKAIEAHLASHDTEAARAAKQYLNLMDEKQQEVDQARADMRQRLQALAAQVHWATKATGGNTASLMQMGDSMKEKLMENVALNAQHQWLTAKLAAAANEARDLVQNNLRVQ